MTVAARRALHPDDAWAAGLALVLVVVPIVLGTIVGSTMLSWLVPIVTTAIAVAAFVVRPTRAIVVIALFVLFIDTVAIGNRIGAAEVEEATVVGPLCTPLDLLAERMVLPVSREGDFVVVFQSGAYGLTASPVNFLGHPVPAEVLI